MGVSVITPSSLRAQTLRCLDRLPKMSPMLTQLLGQLSRRNCEINDLVETVERDPMLSGQILRLANSAIFGRLPLPSRSQIEARVRTCVALFLRGCQVQGVRGC